MLIDQIIDNISTESESPREIVCVSTLLFFSHWIISLSFLWVVGSLDIWAITVEERAKHDQQFHSLKPISGFITGNWNQYFYIFTYQLYIYLWKIYYVKLRWKHMATGTFALALSLYFFSCFSYNAIQTSAFLNWCQATCFGHITDENWWRSTQHIL